MKKKELQPVLSKLYEKREEQTSEQIPTQTPVESQTQSKKQMSCHSEFSGTPSTSMMNIGDMFQSIFSKMNEKKKEQSPVEFPVESHEQSPIESPEQSHIESPEQSHIESPEQSPIESPEQSHVESHEQSPVESPEQSPEQSYMQHSEIRKVVNMAELFAKLFGNTGKYIDGLSPETDGIRVYGVSPKNDDECECTPLQSESPSEKVELGQELSHCSTEPERETKVVDFTFEYPVDSDDKSIDSLINELNNDNTQEPTSPKKEQNQETNVSVSDIPSPTIGEPRECSSDSESF